MRLKTDRADRRLTLDRDPDTGIYRAQFDRAVIDPCMAIVDVLAQITGRDPLALPPLADVIDPAALDLVSALRTDGHPEGDRTVEFAYLDHSIRVKSYGVVEAEPTS